MSQIESQTEYTAQNFKKTSLSQKQLTASYFYQCVFSACNFAQKTLKQCRFIDCTFQGCDLSLLQVQQSVFSNTKFTESKLIGIDWTQANWDSIAFSAPNHFIKSILNHSTFIGLNLQHVQIKSCLALNVDFRETDLSHATFADTDLTKSLFLNTNLTQANLSTARNYTIAPHQNTLTKAKFSLPEAMALLYNLDIVLVD